MPFSSASEIRSQRFSRNTEFLGSTARRAWRGAEMIRITLIAFVALSMGACEREARRFDDDPQAPVVAKLSPLQPGPTVAVSQVRGPYTYNAYGLSEGKILF